MRFGGGGCGDNIDTIGHVKSVRKLKRDAYILQHITTRKWPQCVSSKGTSNLEL